VDPAKNAYADRITAVRSLKMKARQAVVLTSDLERSQELGLNLRETEQRLQEL
jgi:hypothetical protein